METVLDVLKKLGKATFKQVAAQLRIEPVEALNMLREQRELERCDFREGLWVLAGTTGAPAITQELPTKQDKPAAPVLSKRAVEVLVPEKKTTTPKPSKTENGLAKTILDALVGESFLSTEQIAKKTGRTPRGLNASLGALSKSGLVVRRVDKNNLTWGLPTTSAPTCEEPPVAPAQSETKTSIGVLADIPVFTARKTDLIIPTADYISREIRRTESKLASLKKLRTAANNIRRHKSLLQELAQ